MQGQSDRADADFATAGRLDPQGTRLFLLDATSKNPKVADGVSLAGMNQVIDADPRNVLAVVPPPRVVSAPPPSRPWNGPTTVASATQDCERTAWKDPEKIDALAAAHAEAGNLDAAAKDARWRRRRGSAS